MRTEKVLHLPSMLHRHDVSDQLFSEFVAFVGEVQKQKYVFLSKTESIVLEQEGVFKEQLPPDVTLIYIKIEGSSSFVEVKNRSKFKDFGEIRNRDLNSVIIQGSNRVAVRGLEAKVQQLVNPQRFVVRALFYRYPLVSFWSSLILMWFAEYRICHYFYPNFVSDRPLTAVGAIFIFAIALGTTLLYANVLTPLFSYWFRISKLKGTSPFIE